MSAEGEIAELAGICQPGIRVVLNVGPAHLDSLGTLEAVARAKGELVASACPGDTCILNADDPLVASMPVPAGCRTVSAHSDPQPTASGRHECQDMDCGAFLVPLWEKSERFVER